MLGAPVERLGGDAVEAAARVDAAADAARRPISSRPTCETRAANSCAWSGKVAAGQMRIDLGHRLDIARRSAGGSGCRSGPGRTPGPRARDRRSGRERRCRLPRSNASVARAFRRLAGRPRRLLSMPLFAATCAGVQASARLLSMSSRPDRAASASSVMRDPARRPRRPRRRPRPRAAARCTSRSTVRRTRRVGTVPGRRAWSEPIQSCGGTSRTRDAAHREHVVVVAQRPWGRPRPGSRPWPPITRMPPVRLDHQPRLLAQAEAERHRLLGTGDDQPAEPMRAQHVLVEDAGVEQAQPRLDQQARVGIVRTPRRSAAPPRWCRRRSSAATAPRPRRSRRRWWHPASRRRSAP